MPLSKVDLVLAMREGGNVRRCHTVPHHGEYTDGKHSFDAASLVLILHPSPSLALVKAVLWHDMAERWVGDMPAPAKWLNQDLGEAYELAEATAFRRLLGDFSLFTNLSVEDLQWLHAVDRLELELWARDQASLGNRHIAEYITALDAWFVKNYETVPVEVHAFRRDFAWKRLPTNTVL